MAKSDAPARPTPLRVTAIDGHRPIASAGGRFGHQPTHPSTLTEGYQPVVQVGQSIPNGPSPQGPTQSANGGTGAPVPSNPPNQGTSGKK